MTVKRKYCRICAALAGVTRNICDGCLNADVEAVAPPKGKLFESEQVRQQRAWSRAVQSTPMTLKQVRQ